MKSRSSERKQLAQRLAEKIQGLGLTAPYGGEVQQDATARGNPYRIGFASPRNLDGEVTVYGSNFIRVHFKARSQPEQSLILGDENAATCLIDAIAKFDWDVVNSIPRKKSR